MVKPLTEIDRRLREESRSDRARGRRRKKAHAKDDSNPPPGPEPPQLRAIVKDITRESLVIILADNPRGVLCDPDEASGWVASFNEYKGKGGSDRQFWLSVWGSAPVSVDRKGGRESTYVPSRSSPSWVACPPICSPACAMSEGGMTVSWIGSYSAIPIRSRLNDGPRENFRPRLNPTGQMRSAACCRWP